MGSVGLGNNGLLGAFSNQFWPEGLDLRRSVIQEALGVYSADPTSSFLAGQAVMRNSSGLIVKADGTAVAGFMGVAKWNHASAVYSSVADEPVVLNGTTVTSLKHGSVRDTLGTGVGDIKVSATAGGAAIAGNGGANWATDSVSNGTIHRVAGGAIADGATVYVSYSFQLSEADQLAMHGKNFWNTQDEVSQQDNRCVVITKAELIYSMQYNAAVRFVINDALYVNALGLFDTTAAGWFVGRVFQVPTASDPFLGFRMQPHVKTGVPA